MTGVGPATFWASPKTRRTTWGAYIVVITVVITVVIVAVIAVVTIVVTLVVFRVVITASVKMLLCGSNDSATNDYAPVTACVTGA